MAPLRIGKPTNQMSPQARAALRDSGYQEHVRGEIAHYNQLYEDKPGETALFHWVPSAWAEIENRCGAVILAATGNDMVGHVTSRLASPGKNRMLSLGSGTGGVEIAIAQSAPDVQITCTDINPDMLKRGREEVAKLGLSMDFQEVDLNAVQLPRNEYDVVFCHASLHHVLELENLMTQVKRTLRPGGAFIVVDIITANGYRMWPETRPIVQGIFRTLPVQFRTNHTGYREPLVDNEIWEADTSTGSMECIRSEDILPLLSKTLITEFYVPYLSISRRFSDLMYGPNFDLNKRLDLAIFDWIWELDRFYLDSGQLRPETFFGVYRTA